MCVYRQGLIDGGGWPIATEIELLKRVQAMHSQLNEKIRNMTQELKTNQLYPRKVRRYRRLLIRTMLALHANCMLMPSWATDGLQGAAHPLVSHVHTASAVRVGGDASNAWAMDAAHRSCGYEDGSAKRCGKSYDSFAGTTTNDELA